MGEATGWGFQPAIQMDQTPQAAAKLRPDHPGLAVAGFLDVADIYL